MRQTVPLSSPDISDAEHELVTAVLRSGHLSCGPVLEAFEREFAARFGARHAVAMSSGTAALHVAMIAANVRDGDFVITTPFSFVASANAILFERGIPVFVDIDPVSLNIDAGAAVDAIERHGPGGRLRAVLPVHVFGRPAEMHAIVAAARRHGVAVIEDACEAIGASSDGVLAGRWGDAAAFGFYPNKQMTTGEGGVLLTDRDDWMRLARSVRNQGRGDDGSWLQHDRLGYNYRLSDLAAAVGLAQIRRLDDLLAKRAAVAAQYDALLANVDGVTSPAPPRPGMCLSWFLYVVRLGPGVDRDGLMARLAARGVASRPYFPAIHLQPLYRQRFDFRPGMFPQAEAAAASLLALPFHGHLPPDEIEYVCGALVDALDAARA
jgi:perosamine synthetase